LLADCSLGERALPLLREARASADQPVDRLSLDLALAKVHLELSQWRELQEVAGRLVAAVPTSALAFRYQQWAGIQLQQWDAVDAASRERLARLPDDSIAREMLVHSAEARGKFGEIPVIMKPLIESGRATASDYNQYAWTSLLMQPVSEQAVDAARMAYDETQGRSLAINHTLACVYAATGKPREGARPPAQRHGTGGASPSPTTRPGMALAWWPRLTATPSRRATTTRACKNPARA
jgi:hypothetical protein